MDDRTARYAEMLKQHIYSSCGSMTRLAAGQLKHPYIAPTSEDSPYYSHNLWDWDSWLAGITFAQIDADEGGKGKYLEYEKGCVLNFLDLCGEDGYMPICVSPGGDLLANSLKRDMLDTNMHKPVIVQQIASIVQRDTLQLEWVKPMVPKLEAFIGRYFGEFRHAETGLFFWKDDFAVGVDNEPAVFYRPKHSCGSIYLNSLMVRELRAMGYIMEMLGDMGKANAWRLKADELTKAIDSCCWDERDGTFYCVDFALLPVDASDWLHRGAPRDYPCLIMRLDSWTSFMPLWAGACTREQAERMVLRLRDSRTFACRGGVRTLSKLEKMYDLRASNNPSNWRGPVWGISNYMVFSGLVKYGFYDDAKELAEKTVNMFGHDLEINGSLHEYYNPDTCEPIVTHGFENWNYLVLNMIAWLEGRKFADTF